MRLMRSKLSLRSKKSILNARSPEGWVFITPLLVDAFSVLGKQMPILEDQGKADSIRLRALRNRFLTGNEIKHGILNARHSRISSKTVIRRLNPL